jgi:putative ABC transport system permease protein
VTGARRTDPPLPEPGRRWFLNVLMLHRVRLRRRWPQELLAVLGIAVGVALLFASQVASTSLSGPVRDLNRGLVGNAQLQVVARGDGGIAERAADRARSIPGVRIAAPVLEVRANLVGPRGARPITVFGADPRTVRLRGTLLQGFTAEEAAEQESLGVPGPIARAIGVRFGDEARLQIAARARRVPVAVVDRSDVGALEDTSVALAPLRYLQGLARRTGRVSRILIEAEPGRLATVRRALARAVGPGADVRDADHESRLFDLAVAPTSQATTISSVVSALVGFLFAFCAMLVTVAGRRALAIDLRLDGYRPGQVARILLFDALVLGVVAVALGLVLGDALSRRGYGSDVTFLGGAFPLGEARIVTPWAFVVAVGGGLAAATLGVLAPLAGVLLDRTARTGRRPGPAPAARARVAVPAAGALCLVGAVVITAFAPGAAIAALVLLLAALLLLLPAILVGTVGALEWVSRRRSRSVVAVELALPGLRAREWRARSIAIATTGAVAVFGAVALQGARANLQAGLGGVSTQLNAAADLWVSPYGPGSLLATDAFSPAVTRELADVPGVAALRGYRASFLDVADRRAWVLAPPSGAGPPVPGDQVLEGSRRDVTARLRAGGWATVSRALADALGARVGDTFVLPSPRPLRLRVAAITTNLGWTGGSTVLAPDDYVRGWGTRAVSATQVRLAPGVSPAEARERVAAALGAGSALRVETAAGRVARQEASARSGLTRLGQIAWLTLVAAVLAMASAMTALLWQRRTGVARQKIDGLSTGAMWRSLAVESATLFVTGCLAGALFALLGQILFTRGLATISGFPVVATVRAGVAATSFAVVAGVALLAVLVPGALVARVRPSLRTED